MPNYKQTILVFLGTQLDNIRDMISKKRHPISGRKGSESRCAILNDDKVREIKKLLSVTPLKRGAITNIGKMFGVSEATISNIYNNKIWGAVL
jgi:hypothetical protein